MAATAMRFCVSVPVLSTHRVVTEPSVSTAGIRRVSTRLCERRHAPKARKTVSTTGNSSGIMAIAKVSPARNPSSQSPRVSENTMTTTQQSPRPASASPRTRRSTSRCSRVRSGWRVDKASPMRPISVAGPVAETTAVP